MAMLSQLKHVFRFHAVTRRLLNTSTVLKLNYPAVAKSASDPHGEEHPQSRLKWNASCDMGQQHC